MKVCTEQFKKGKQGIHSDGFYMDGLLKSNLDIAKEAVKKDWDMVFVIDGPEGVGKSVMAQQMAFYCDPTLTLKRIAFRPDSFKEAVLNAEQFQSVIFDEAYGGLASRKAMSATNKILVDMMTEIRQKNLFIFIVLPTFFDLDKYVALWRSRCLVNVYHDKFQRGYFKFYSSTKKKDLFVQGKKFYNYRVVKPDFMGRFTNFYPMNEKKYKQKKLDSLRAYSYDTTTSKSETNRIERGVYIRLAKHLRHDPHMKKTLQEVSDILDAPMTTIRGFLKS